MTIKIKIIPDYFQLKKKIYFIQKNKCIKTESKILKLKNHDKGLALSATKGCYKAIIP